MARETVPDDLGEQQTAGLRKLRVLYLSGPGDSAAVLRRFAAGNVFDEVAHVAYSGQMFDVCSELGAALLAVSSNSRLDDFSHGNLRAINLPDLFPNRAGLSYHTANLRFAREVFRRARSFNANIVITATEPYPFLLEPLAWRGVRIIPALHATLLPEFKKPTVARRFFTRLSRHFFQRTCTAILSHPGAAARQAHALAAGRPRPIVEFLPLYRSNVFAGIEPPERSKTTFNVLTVGRVEREKGVFDLIEVARRIKESGRSNIRFDVSGAGGALEPARDLVRRLSLEEMFTLHGWCTMSDLLDLWQRSDAAVVPTTRDFVEGFNQVVIEAMLAGRPVITSDVCPALDFVRPSCIEVPADNVDGYRQAILRLADDRPLYDSLQRRCEGVAQQFLDPEKSFGRAVSHVLAALAADRTVSSVRHPPIS